MKSNDEKNNNLNESNSTNSIILYEINEENSLDERLLNNLKINIVKESVIIDDCCDVIVSNDYENILIKNISKRHNNMIEMKHEKRDYMPNHIKTTQMSSIPESEHEKHNNQIKTFITKLKTICEINVQSFMIINKLYSVISKKYISRKTKTYSKQNSE